MSCSCGCCSGVRTETPAPVHNPPGRSAIAYRMGTHGQFVASQLARLSSRAYPELATLTTREPDDLAIALLDGWAVVADVLTFYQERIANEGYLRTATEQESLTALGRLVGYEPRPALGSSTFLAYTLDPGARTTVPTGTRSKSTAAPGEQPQTFETSEDLDAREEWNALAVRRTRAPLLDFADISALTRLDLDGVAVNAKPGDRMVFVFDETDPNTPPVIKIVSAATPVFELARTTIAFGTAEPVAEYDAALAELADGIDDAVATAPDHPFARRIVETYLSPLRARVGGRPAARDFARVLFGVLTLLSEEREIARVRVVRPVVGWSQLDGVVQAGARTLDAALRTARISHPEVEQLRNAADNLACSSNGNSLLAKPEVRSADCEDCPSAYALVGLLPVLPALRKPPSRPPALALRAQDVFGTESDTLPRLLALDPKVGDTLFQALANTDLAKPLPLSSLQILRQRAKPFGANAPLPPPSTTTPPDGGIGFAAQSDWPFEDLDTKQNLEAVVTYTDGQPASAHLTYRFTAAAGGGATTVSTDISFETLPASVELEPGTVDAARTDTGVRLTFSGGLPDREMSFSAEENGTVRVTVRGNGEVALSVADSPVTEKLGSDGITASRVENQLSVGDEITPATTVLSLDAAYEGVVAGQVVVIERPSLPKPLVIRITKVEEVSLAKYNLVGPSTQLTLAEPWIDADAAFSELRQTNVFVRGEALSVAEDPVPDDVGGGEIELDRLYDGLTPGRWLVVSGERTDIPFTTGVSASELVMLGGVKQTVDPDSFGERTHTTLVLANDLAYTYRRATVTVLGNVVEATQGESRGAVLGSGAAATPNQTFTLSQSPVTWLPAVTPSGAESTLNVRVNGVRWQPADGLVWLGPTDHGYVARTAGSATTVTFGDGVHGARLPTGVENVIADFRLGAGRTGNVATGAVNQVISRPLGVNAVTNPLPATGGTDTDGPEDARVTIPLRVRALDRLVSVRDYEDFTRARAGIGKAAALALTDGQREVVHVTIAGADDAPIDPSSRLFRTLEAALAEFGDVRLPVRVDLRELALIVLSANVAVLPDYSWELVEPAVRAAVLGRFSFDSRELGRPAFLSEALAAMQAVAGVDYVDVDVFGHVPADVDPTDLVSIVDSLAGVNTCVPAHPARFEERHHHVRFGESLTWIARLYGLTVAELLRLNPDVDTADLEGRDLLVRRGIRPAQLAVLSPAVPETLILRRIQ
jgi:predicted phage baseplate assembly protein